jgi:competence protein ComEC
MMSPAIFFRPAIPLLISLIIGILLGSEYGGFEFGAAAAAVLGSLCIVRNIYRRQSGVACPALLFLALGYLSIAPWIQPRFPADHIIHHTGPINWDITGIIDGPPQHLNNRIRFVIRKVSLADGHRTVAVCGKLRVSAAGRTPPIAAGDEVKFRSRIRLTSNFKNPGGFDYQRYMAFKGIWTTAFARRGSLAVLSRHRSSHAFEMIGGVRQAFANLIETSGNSEAQAVLKALIIGDRSQISPKLRQAFNRAGTGHLLAISGLHIGIVAAVAFTIFHFLAACMKPLLWQAWSRKAAALLTLLPVLLYGMVAGFSPSTQRAVIMVAVFLLTFLFESEQDPLNTLSLAGMLILIIDPPSLFSISFQLSFIAVLGIIYGLSRLQELGFHHRKPAMKNIPKRWSRILLSFFLVSTLAICSSLPLVAHYFNQISLIGIATNFIVVPLIGCIAVPLGLAGLLVLPVSLTLASWLIEVDAFILSYTLSIVKFFAELPFAAVKTVTPSLLEMACFYILGWALLNLKRTDPVPAGTQPMSDHGHAACGHQLFQKRNSMLTRLSKPFHALRHNSLTTSAWAKITLSLLLLILGLNTCYWLYERHWYPDLRVTVIDVGHGSAALLELPGGHTVLVDGGGFSDNSTFDVGERIIAPFLWRKKIRTVDTLILSHPNSDHVNGLIYIARHFNVKNVLTNNESCDTKGYALFMEVISRQKIPLATFESLPRRYRINDVELNLLYPPPNFLKLIPTQKWRNTNNNSLVVKISFKSVSFLFPGDIMADAEDELVRLAGDRLASTVLIAPHHGSRTSNSSKFIEAVNPEITVFSSGRSARFKLPHAAVLKRYQNRGCQIWRTAVNGAIQFSTDGGQLKVKAFQNTESPGADELTGN